MSTRIKAAWFSTDDTDLVGFDTCKLQIRFLQNQVFIKPFAVSDCLLKGDAMMSDNILAFFQWRHYQNLFPVFGVCQYRPHFFMEPATHTKRNVLHHTMSAQTVINKS